MSKAGRLAKYFGTLNAVFLATVIVFLYGAKSVQAASADGVISVDFVGTGNPMATSEVAGVIVRSFWNTATGASNSIGLKLVDDAGYPTSATVTWNSTNGWRLPVTDAPGNIRMLEGYLDTMGANTTVMVAGLPSNSSGYDVYVYADGDNGAATRTGKYQISGAGITTTTTNLTDAANTNYNGNFVQANNSVGNFVKFSVEATGFTITAIPGSASDGIERAPINGIQIVPRSTPALTANTYLLASYPAATSGTPEYVTSWSGFITGVGAEFDATKVGDTMSFTLNVPAAGNYDVRVAAKKWVPRAIWQLSVGGTNVGAPQDDYAASTTWTEADLGTATISASGNVTFKFTVVGENSSSSGYRIVLDYIKLIPNSTTTSSPPPVAPAQIAISPTSMSFNSVVANTTSAQTLTVSNPGGSNLLVTNAIISGSAFSLVGATFPITIAAGQSSSLGVRFSPATTGTFSGSVTVSSSASNTAPSITLSGSATATSSYLLGASPTSLSFGSVAEGSSASKTIALSNTGTASVSVSAANFTGMGFSLSGASLPFTVTAGSTHSITILFTPQTSGPASGSVSFVSNATNSPVTVSLSGSGTVPVQHSVDLSWNASTSSLSGYDVYRGTVSGGPYTKLTSSPQAGTSYVDSTVQSGLTYYYVVTSVSSSGTESGYSNQAVAAVPTP